MRILIIIAFTFLFSSAFGQLRRDFTQIYRNAPYLNPGFAGIESFFEINAGAQQAWSGDDANQASVFVSGYGRIGYNNPVVYEKNSLRISDPSRYREIARTRKEIYRKHGIGGRIASVSVGPLIQQQAMFTYAYHVPLTTDIRLSFGTNLSLLRQEINLQSYTVRNEDDDRFFQELLRQGDGRSTSFNAGFGAVLYGDNFFVGLSGRSLFSAELNNSLQVESLEPGRTYTFIGAMDFKAGQDFTIRPGIKADYSENTDISIRPNISVRWKESVSLGTYYEFEKALTLLLAVQLSDGLRIGYSYDHFTGDLGLLNRNNHEITLSFFINNKYGISPFIW
jgi:type IX secretion system PorP/SprF family membrane protein